MTQIRPRAAGSPITTCHNGSVSNSMPVRGAVDLGALAAAREAKRKAAAAPAGVVIDVTEATFQAEVIERSLTVPVLVDLWASWCGPCKTLSPLLERLAADYTGRWVLAKVDVDAEQRLAALFQVQSIPSVFAVLKGQPLPLFQGALPEAQLRQYLDAVLAEAAKLGVNGTLPAGTPAAVPEPSDAIATDPDTDAAYGAMERGDWDAADRAFSAKLERDPTDEGAKVGLATAGMYRRVAGTDARAAVDVADADPTDLGKQLLAADVQASNHEFSAAFDRLIEYVRRSAGEDRQAARERLLQLFEVAGPGHPAVAKARVGLANALF